MILMVHNGNGQIVVQGQTHVALIETIMLDFINYNIFVLKAACMRNASLIIIVYILYSYTITGHIKINISGLNWYLNSRKRSIL